MDHLQAEISVPQWSGDTNPNVEIRHETGMWCKNAARKKSTVRHDSLANDTLCYSCQIRFQRTESSHLIEHKDCETESKRDSRSRIRQLTHCSRPLETLDAANMNVCVMISW